MDWVRSTSHLGHKLRAGSLAETVICGCDLWFLVLKETSMAQVGSNERL